jgi:hypothetical protein
MQKYKQKKVVYEFKAIERIYVIKRSLKDVPYAVLRTPDVTTGIYSTDTCTPDRTSCRQKCSKVVYQTI